LRLQSVKDEDLLYVSNYTDNEVYVYSYPHGKLVRVLSGFEFPAGICPDRSGNVWIANFSGTTLVEYAHGGDKPIATLNAPKGFSPQECAIDPTTGNLAVVGFYRASPSTPDTVFVYAGGAGTPIVHATPFADISFAAYDNKGNLFVDGVNNNTSPPFVLAELQKRATHFKAISFGSSSPPSIYPGPIRWDGKYLAVGSPYRGFVRYAIRNYTAIQQGTVQLSDVSSTFNAWIQGSTVAAVNIVGSYPPVQVYNYPAGGKPIRIISAGFSGKPYGLAVSLAQPCSPPENGAAVHGNANR
jgi:hypothetical protein